MLELLAGVWWLREAQIQGFFQGWLETHFVYLALRTSVLEMGETVRLGKKKHTVVKAEWKCIFIWLYDFLFCFHTICCMSLESSSDGDFLGSLFLVW